MLSLIGLSLLYFLPVIESFDRTWGMNILFAGSLLFGMSCILKGRFRLNGIGIIFLLLLIYFLGIIPFSWSIGSSYIEFLRYLSYFLVFITVINYEDKVQLFKNYIVPVVIINTLILSFLYWLYSFSGLHLAPPENGTNLFYPTFRHNRISDILTIAIPLCLYMGGEAKNYKKLLILGLTTLFLSFLLLSLGLGAIAALAYSLFLFVFISKRYNDHNFTSPLVIIFGLITSVIIFGSFIYSNLLVKDYNNAIYKNLFKPLQTELRLDFLKQAIEGFKISPIIGTGLDTFHSISIKYRTKSEAKSWYVHNHYMELFTETGIIGGILFLILMFVILRKAYQVTNISINHNLMLQNSYIFIILFALSLLSLVDYSFHYLSIFLYFFMCAGIVMPDIKGKSLTINKYLVITLIFILYSVYILFPIDVYISLFRADSFMQSGRKDEAIKTLLQAYIWDKKNYGIAKRLGFLYEDNDIKQAHKWYEYAISLDPLDSTDIIKKDYDLYLEEIQVKLDRNEYDTIYDLIRKVRVEYPFYLKSQVIDQFIQNQASQSGEMDTDKGDKLKGYFTHEKKSKNKRKLTIPEIRMIPIDEITAETL